MQQFSAPGSEAANISLKNPEGVRKKEEAEGLQGKQGARGGGEGAEGEEIQWAEMG